MKGLDIKVLIKIVCILVTLLLTLSSCDTLAEITEFENASTPSASQSPSEELPVLSLEELQAVKDRIASRRAEDKEYMPFIVTRSGYELMMEQYKDYPERYAERFVHAEIMGDIERTEYVSSEMVRSITKGMYINEVKELLGLPHYSVVHYAFAVFISTSTESYDVCTMYILNDGRILLLRYTPITYEKYDRQELMARIPDYEQYERINKDGYHTQRWLQLNEISFVTVEELLEMTFDNDFLETPDKNRQWAEKEDLQKIEQGMTYDEVVELVGAAGYECSLFNDVYTYYWRYENKSSDLGYGEFEVNFFLDEDDMLIVSEVGSTK